MTEVELTSAVDEYFNRHLDKKFWNGLNADTKTGSIAMALSDVLSIVTGLSLEKISSGTASFKAVAEQAVFLARNYENISEGKVVTSEGVEGISVGYTVIGDMTVAFRAVPFIKQAKREFLGASMRISRG